VVDLWVCFWPNVCTFNSCIVAKQSHTQSRTAHTSQHSHTHTHSHSHPLPPQAIRRKDPLPDKIDNVPRSLHVLNIPQTDNNYNVTVEEVKEVFSKFGEVQIVRFRFLKADKMRKLDKKCLGEVFVEYASAEGMEKALAKAVEENVAVKPDGSEEKSAETSESFTLKGNVVTVQSMKSFLDASKAKRDGKRAKRDAKKKESCDDSTNDADKESSVGGDAPLEVEKITWEKGCVVSLAGLPEDCDREAIKEAFDKGGLTDGVYVDYSRGQEDGAVRLDAPNALLVTVAEKLAAGELEVGGKKIKEAKVLEGEEETKYWEQAAIMKAKRKRGRETQDNRGGKRRKGGRR